MISPTKKAKLTQIGEADLKRFVVQSALLNLIDPVRGTPTRTLLNESLDNNILGVQQLKQNFLDSFALICSTSSSGAETASAVCLEQHGPAGAVLRVARNRGLTTKDLNGLEEVLEILRLVSRNEKPSTQAEQDLLRKIVELDRGRILSIAEKVHKRGIRKDLQQAHARLLSGEVKLETRASPGFKLWLERCPFTAAPPHTWNPETVAFLILWSSDARTLYSEPLKDLIVLDQAQTPPWLDSLRKIARYRFAIKSMIKLAAQQPEVFAGILIQGVNAPGSRPFFLSLKEKAPLLETVKKLVKEDSGIIMEQLEKHLSTQDAEAELHKACRLNLTLHAEMQLVLFYEGNPASIPRMLFIGTSKKACFHCHEYLLRHPLGLQVMACHQKIYPSWMPPPSYKIPGQSRSIPFTKLSKRIEQLTKEELRTALNNPRRPRNQDSTAGPSLSITTTVPTVLVVGMATKVP